MSFCQYFTNEKAGDFSPAGARKLHGLRAPCLWLAVDDGRNRHSRRHRSGKPCRFSIPTLDLVTSTGATRVLARVIAHTLALEDPPAECVEPPHDEREDHEEDGREKHRPHERAPVDVLDVVEALVDQLTGVAASIVVVRRSAVVQPHCGEVHGCHDADDE